MDQDSGTIFFLGSGSADTYVFVHHADGATSEIEVVLDSGQWKDADTLEPIAPGLARRFTRLMEVAD
jgi:hypothetical protein